MLRNLCTLYRMQWKSTPNTRSFARSLVHPTEQIFSTLNKETSYFIATQCLANICQITCWLLKYGHFVKYLRAFCFHCLLLRTRFNHILSTLRFCQYSFRRYICTHRSFCTLNNNVFVQQKTVSALNRAADGPVQTETFLVRMWFSCKILKHDFLFRRNSSNWVIDFSLSNHFISVPLEIHSALFGKLDIWQFDRILASFVSLSKPMAMTYRVAS